MDRYEDVNSRHMPVIGLLTLELHLVDSHSLKDKRHYVLGLKERLRKKFNLAVSETEDMDLLNRAVIAAVTVSASRPHAERVLRAAEEQAAAFLGPYLVEAWVEWVELTENIIVAWLIRGIIVAWLHQS